MSIVSPPSVLIKCCFLFAVLFCMLIWSNQINELSFDVELDLCKKPSPHQSSHTSNSMSDESTHRPPSSLPPRPRPILIKLSCPWDRRIILANKRKLSETEGMGKYFFQPDLSLDERKKRREHI